MFHTVFQARGGGEAEGSQGERRCTTPAGGGRRDARRDGRKEREEGEGGNRKNGAGGHKSKQEKGFPFSLFHHLAFRLTGHMLTQPCLGSTAE